MHVSGDPGVVRQYPDHRIVFNQDSVVKEATTAAFAARLEDEKSWYRFVRGHGFLNVPRVLRWDPFELERVDGVPLHHLTGLSDRDRQAIFSEALQTVSRLHSLADHPTSRDDLRAMYEAVPLSCLDRVAATLGNGWPRPQTVNGRRVDHLDFEAVRSRVRESARLTRAPARFVPVHGDLALSNVWWDRRRRRIVLISPRGLFGNTAVFGDALYDWGRLHFALRANPDALVEGAFRLDRDANAAQVRLGSTGWESMTGHVRATLLDRQEDLTRLEPAYWLLLAGALHHRPAQLEAAYLLALESIAARDE
jgi:hypothetical protein